jgi:hypothetical protein
MVQWTPAYSVLAFLATICLAGLAASLWLKPARQPRGDTPEMLGDSSLNRMQAHDRSRPEPG